MRLPKVVGKFDAAGAGRSMGGLLLNPNASAVLIIRSGPMYSVPIRANAELHDTASISNSAPPQLSWSKFEMANWSSTFGGVYDVAVANTGVSRVTTPASSPAVEVTTLNVDPGKKISR